MKTKNRIVWLVLGLMLTACPGSGYAQIALDPAYTGTVVVTNAEDKVTVLDEGTEVPEIASGSNVEIFDGFMQVTLEEGEKLSLGCGGNSGEVSGPATIEVSCTEKEAYYKVIKGNLSLTTVDGETFELKEGDRKDVRILPETEGEADETEANDEPASQIDPEAAPVDSRSLESSPT